MNLYELSLRRHTLQAELSNCRGAMEKELYDAITNMREVDRNDLATLALAQLVDMGYGRREIFGDEPKEELIKRLVG